MIEDYDNNLLTEEAKERLQNLRAKNTERSYNSDWKDFVAYCKANNEEYYPAMPETIVNYMNHLTHTVKANTISRHLTAISEKYKEAGFAVNPAKSYVVKATMTAIRRETGVHQEGKKPILIETLRQIIASIPDTLDGIRDKALITLGFAGAFRRSELVGITIDNISFSEKGMTIFIPKSKTDQEGQGIIKGIPYSSDLTICPVRATIHWLEKSGLNGGYLFRGFTKRTIKDSHLSSQCVPLILKKYLELAGLDSTEYAGHSLRSGFVTEAAQKGVSVYSIMTQTGHRTEGMVHRYIKKADVFENNPLNMIY